MKGIFQTLNDVFNLNFFRLNLTFKLSLVLIALNAPSAYAQYVSGDTSVCPNQVVNYNFSGGPWTITVLGGGNLTPVPGGPVNTFTITWGTFSGSYLIRLVSVAGATIYQSVVVEGDLALACDDLVNVSLDGNCTAIITPGVMVEGSSYPDDSYLVTVYNTNGIPIPGNVVDYSFLGKTLKVNVRHLCSNVSCWGRIFIEDKFIPDLLCNPNAVILSCDQDYSPEAIGYPIPKGATVTINPNNNQCFVIKNFDLCCDVDLCYTDIYIKNGCNATYYAQVQRTWVATDCKGNKTSCIDSIYLTQGTLENLRCPLNHDGFDLPALNCDEKEPADGPFPSGWNALDNGNPSPYDYVKDGQVIWTGTGFPVGIHCDHIAVTFRDIRIPVCENSFKLLRTWRIFDWCTGALEECVQFIKVVDNKPPIVSCALNYLTFPTDYYKCSGTAIVPPPDLILDCNSTTFTVEYKLAGPDGKPEGGDYRTDNVRYVNGNAVISNLPIDTTWVQFIVTDACGNSTKCRTEVLIKDNLDPVAICDGQTVVSINEFGTGELFASSIDDGSYDNCSLDSMAIRRMNDWCGIVSNTNFGRSVTFCCEDLVHNPHMVVFRVWDKQGNFNDCMVSVIVQEKIPPTIACPNNVTVDCGTDLADLKKLGKATASNICANTKITYKDDTISWKCGSGSIRRRWIATSAGGQFTACDQSITVRDNNPVTVNSITWPRDLTINGCRPQDAHPDFAGKPSFPIRPCSNLIAGFTDERFYNVDGYCIKIIRHWRVIDWCLYDVNDPNSAGIFTREQIIFVKNSDAPDFLNPTCVTKEVCANDLSCDANIELVGLASDDCTDDNHLIWSYRVDLNNDGSFGPSLPGNNASGFYPGGTHKLEWTVTDSCGNSSTCNKIFRIKDCKQPTPFCKPGLITVIMPSTKSIAVNAKFFDEKSEDNCTSRDKLRFSFSPNTSDSVRTYTCADIENGREDTLEVKIYVTDLDGNQNFCITSLVLQDNNGNVCIDKFTNGGVIAGLINTVNSSVLQNAHLELIKSNAMFGTINSESNGEYVFVDLPEGEDYQLHPVKDDDVSNGITTGDIVLIQKHILGLQKFNSAYQYIAADVNGSKTITAADISELRKLILGITDSFKNGVSSWTFLKKDFVFSDQENPWANYPWESAYELKGLQGKLSAIDFMAIKMGDINYSAKTRDFNSTTEKRSADKIYFEVENNYISAPAEINIPVYGNWKGGLSGFQMTLAFNTSVAQFIGIKSGAMPINENNYGINQLHQGLLPVSWNGNLPIVNTNLPLFYLKFNVSRSIQISDLVGLNHSYLNVEAYNENLEILDIELKLRGNSKTLSQYELFQNQPNPFDERTLIGFYLPYDQTVNLTLFDINGSVILDRVIKGLKGKNQQVISKSDLSQGGIYYYQLKAEYFNGVKKLIFNK